MTGGAAIRRLRRTLFAPALLAYAIKGGNAAASFLATVIIARTAGAETVGHYGLAVTTGALLGIIALRGLDQILLRQVAGDLRQERTGAARGTLAALLHSVLVSGGLVTLVYAAAVLLGPVAQRLNSDQSALLVAASGVMATGLFRLTVAGVRAVGLPVAGQFFEGLSSFLFAGVVGAMWLAGVVPSAALAVGLFFGCQLASSAAAWWSTMRAAREWAPAEPVALGPLHAAGLPIMGSMAIHQATDWLLLALVATAGTPAEVGAFRVAVQVMLLIATIVATGENYVSARMAGDFRAGRPDLAWAKHNRATWLMLAIAGPPILLALLFPRELLAIAFGPEFAVAGPALAVMAIGQAVNVAAGPVGGLLTMGGRERLILLNTLVAFAMAVTLSVLLIPKMGLMGAAIAYSVTIGARRGMAWLWARRLIPRKPPA